MVPVSLRLRNFMSYGTAAPELDFRPIHVACLSGGNGQGKSALLDAMTWAVWGEARKSSGSRKPDDDIIRIGTQRMQVVFTFDVDGQRYRIDRSYQRSATGKTSRAELEVYAFDPASDSYIELTGSSMKETQDTILQIVGIDYDTFINSAFLLQGRSDEFTKKRPSERKEILSRILNLDRFQKLYARARDRARDAKTEASHKELEIKRLVEAVAHEEEWKEERDTLKEEIEECQQELSGLREEEQELTRQLVRFEALEREQETIQQDLEALDKRRDQLEQDRVRRMERIEKAEKLLSQAEAIEDAANTYRKLEKERDRLDDKQERHRMLERRLAERERFLAEKRHALENRLSTLKADRRAACEQLERYEQQLAQRPAIVKKLKVADQAQEELKVLQEKMAERERLQQELSAVERAIHGKREALQGELRALEQRCLRDGRALPDLGELERELERLTEQLQRRNALDEQLGQIREHGQGARERLHSIQGQIETRQAELEEEREAYETFRRADGDECPLCGTELTNRHRQRVLREYESSIARYNGSLERLSAQAKKAEEKVEALRTKYRTVLDKRNDVDGVPERLATAQERYERAKEARSNLEDLQQQADELRSTLEQEAFAEEERRRVESLREQLQSLSIDDDRLERLREETAQVGHYERRLQEMETVEQEREQLISRIEDLDEEIGSVKTSLEDEGELSALQTEIEGLREDISDLDFDSERLAAVREQLRELAEAPSRLTELEHARRSHAEWLSEQERLSARMKELQEERARREKREGEVVEALKKREPIEAERGAIREKRESAEEALQEKQQRYGQVSQQLEQVRRDRKRLRETRKELEEVKRRQRLYRHLRVAFSKHGIPSLLIEQALPEVEQRANDLLERITDGRMRVRLETLKDKKTGGTKETLEIIITDEQGVPRAYETFSGGEAFRVNFALRLALAQLLAERSGAQVHTLIIDEGFGTQDEEGVESLVEAIHSIKDDFEKILVITHLSDLKEAFPVRIEVEKDPAIGSTFEVIGV